MTKICCFPAALYIPEKWGASIFCFPRPIAVELLQLVLSCFIQFHLCLKKLSVARKVELRNAAQRRLYLPQVFVVLPCQFCHPPDPWGGHNSIGVLSDSAKVCYPRALWSKCVSWNLTKGWTKFNPVHSLGVPHLRFRERMDKGSECIHWACKLFYLLCTHLHKDRYQLLCLNYNYHY